MKKIVIATIIMGISMGLVGCSNLATSNNKNSMNSKITIEEAKEIALKNSNLTSEADSEVDHGIEKYNIEFYHDNKEYDYEINAADGQIIEYDYDVENYSISEKQGTNESVNEITIEEAKEIALNHANLKSDQVTFGRTETDIDNGVEKFEIEFYHNNKEYDYQINATDGQIISYDYDAEYNNTQQETINNSTVKISVEEAKEIALKHANLKGDEVNFGKVELDVDHGVQQYDVEVYYNSKEYNYEIDANTGSILSYEQD